MCRIDAGKLIVRALRWYQRVISPLFRGHCIYVPTCSQYAVEAISTYGTARGSLLAVRRVLRCNPLHRGGFDPVP